MCAPMGLWLSTSVGPFCPAHLDGASYANEIPQNGPPAVIVQSNRGWNHPFGVVFFSADPFKGKERYRKVSSFWLCCNTADWGRGTWAYLASCSHSIWWLSYFNRCRTKVTLLAVRNWNLRCLYIYIYTDQLDQLEVAYGQPYAHTPWSHVRQPTAPLSGCPEVCSTSFPPRLAIRSSLAAPCVADI